MRRLLLFLIIVALLALTSCGGSNGGISGEKETPQPVSVSILEDSATVETGETFQFHASVNNATDTTITWTVEGVVGGNATVGTMSADGLYTAPTGVPTTNPVTVKATSNADKTKSDTAKVTIFPKFAISPPSATVRVGETQQFTANQEVDVWWVNDVLGGNNVFGTISNTGLYTAPAKVPSPSTVTVKANEKRDNNKTATATVTILGLSGISISPTDVTVPAGATQQFTLTPAGSDVTWEVTGATGTDAGTWGKVSDAGLYTAPVTPPWTGKVNVKATLKSDTTKTANAVVTVVFSNATLNGHYVLRYRGVDKATDPSLAVHIWAVGSFVADGKGGISGGSIDINQVSTAYPQQPLTTTFTGTYAVGTDGRTTATFTLQMPSGAETFPVRWVMISNTAARMIGFDDTGSGWGNIDMQDTASFSAGLSGKYVFSYDGLNNARMPYAGVGMFTANAGVISPGIGDFNDQLGARQGAALEGTYSSLDPATGRGTWTFVDQSMGNYWSFALYALGSSAFVFSCDITGFGFLGVAVQQDTSSAFSVDSLSGNSVFSSAGYYVDNGEAFPVTWAGRATADGNGQFPEGVSDRNLNGTTKANVPWHGVYAIDSDGRGRGSFTDNNSVESIPVGVYMIAPNNAFWISFTPYLVTTGQLMPQASGDYDASTIRGSLAFYYRATFVSAGADMAGQMTSDGAGNLTGKVDMNEAGAPAENISFTGTYSVSDNGRGEVAINEGLRIVHYVLYLASGRTGFMIPIDAGDPAKMGFIFRQF